MLLQEKTITIESVDFPQGKEFIISKLPATVGREVAAKYSNSNIPIIGKYALSEEIMFKLMCYVAVPGPVGSNQKFILNSVDLVNNHTVGWETLGKLEVAMLEYNISFLQRGEISNFFDGFAEKMKQWIMSMLTDFSQQSSQKNTPPFTNSEPSTL